MRGSNQDGPFGGPLARVPIASRLAVTIGVVVGLFASIVLSNASERVSMVALWVGIGGGVLVGLGLWARAGRRR